MKIAVIGTPGGWSSEKLADSVADLTGFRMLIDMKKVCLDLENRTVTLGDLDLSTLDACIIKKIGSRYSPHLMDRLEILRFLFERGLPMFSSPLAIMRVLDRLSCTTTLQLGGIPMPPTVITENVDCAMDALESFGEAVFKPLYTSKARGMRLLRNGPGARAEVASFKEVNPILYIQKKIDLGGRDLGVVFLGGQYLTTYSRWNEGDTWNTTTASGGKYRPFDPSPETLALAQRAQDLFHLDFTCVDVAETPEGTVVFEVSAFGGFRGIEDARRIDAARRYVEYVLGKVSP